MNKLVKDIEKEIAKQTNFSNYDWLEMPFAELENEILDLGTFNDDEEEVILTPKEEKIKTLLTKELKIKIDTAFSGITKMLKRKHNIIIETPTHKNFGFLMETEMGDFMNIVMGSIKELQIKELQPA